MKNTINLKINNAEYTAVPLEVAKAIEVMLASYKAEAPKKAKASTPKTEPKKAYAKAYAVTEDGKGITVGGDGFIPTKVFKGITYSLKTAGASYDAKTKAWTFKTKKSCEAWQKAQDARA